MKFARTDLPFGLRTKPVGRVVFVNDEFVRSHGVRPSGQGSWAFEFCGRHMNSARLFQCVNTLRRDGFNFRVDQVGADGKLLRLWAPVGTFTEARVGARWVLGVCCSSPLVGLIASVAP